MEYTPASIVSKGHVVLTGPIQGTVTLDDGTVVDVGPQVIEVSNEEHAQEVAHLIALRYQEEGHPNVPVSEENPKGFVYEQNPPQEN